MGARAIEGQPIPHEIPGAGQLIKPSLILVLRLVERQAEQRVDRWLLTKQNGLQTAGAQQCIDLYGGMRIDRGDIAGRRIEQERKDIRDDGGAAVPREHLASAEDAVDDYFRFFGDIGVQMPRQHLMRDLAREGRGEGGLKAVEIDRAACHGDGDQPVDGLDAGEIPCKGLEEFYFSRAQQMGGRMLQYGQSMAAGLHFQKPARRGLRSGDKDIAAEHGRAIPG